MKTTLIESGPGNFNRRCFVAVHGGGVPAVKECLKLFFVVASVVFFVSGCGVLKPIENPSGGGGSSQPDQAVAGVYHDFDDILVPKTMQVNRRMSSVFETSTISAGVLSLGGALKTDVLIEFFKVNMAKDNWTLVSMLKGTRSILQFEKGNRWCVMTLTDRRYGYKTQLEIWVTPKKNALASGLLK